MIRAVFFDLDGTLYDRDSVMRNLVKEQFGVFRESLGGVSESRFVQRILELDAHGQGDKPLLYESVVAEWGLGCELADRLVRYFRDRYDRHCSLSDDVSATLQTLRTCGKKLGVITNGGFEWQQQTLRSLGLASFFDTVLISDAEGLRKPDSRIFARALERCEVNPGEALFVGDHPEIDVAGATAAGLIAVWKRVPYWELAVENALTVDQLSEILPLCLNR
jgi:putative hydrolase of the HAD superfamily